MKILSFTLFMLAVFALMPNWSNAQEKKSNFISSVQFGLKLGINYSNVYNVEGEQFVADPKFGLVGGAFVAIPFGEVIGFQPEIHFSQKGFKATGEILGNTYEFKCTTTYLDLPLLFALKPGKMFTVLIGPQFSHLITKKDMFSTGSSSIEQEEEFENEDYRKNTLCFLTGADINKDHLVIGARVGWDLLKNNRDGSASTPRYKNVWYQVTLGYRFY